MDLIHTLRMDKTQFSIRSLEEPGDEKAYWAEQTPQKRMQAMKLMRKILYGYHPVTDRLQRVFVTIEA